MLSRKTITPAAVVVLFSAVLNPNARGQFQPGEFITYSQDSWGAYPPPSNAAQVLIDRFHEFYGGGIEVGISGNAGFSMIFSSVASVLNYLPSSGAPAALNADLIDPTSTSSGLFGGWVLALQFDVDFNDAGYLTGTAGIPFGDLVLVDLTLYPEFNGLTIREFLMHTNSRLGGDPPYTYDDIAALTDDVTRAFEGGTPTQFAQDHLRIVIPGDFDFDRDVDGRDFLVWQRGGSPRSSSAEDLADWEANYGADPGALAAAATVPEPATWIALLLALLAPQFHRDCRTRFSHGR
jgi:hypothetical protein